MILIKDKRGYCQCKGKRQQGDVKVYYKPVALVKSLNPIKSQISSTKLQTNLKSQYSMTKTFAKIAAHKDAKSGEPGMLRLDAIAGAPFVCIFEFGSLGFVWDLGFGAWNFQDL
jgi:hypothetical protein